MARWAESVLITLFFCLVPQKCYPSIVKNWHATSLMEKLSNKKVWANGKVNGEGWKCVYNIYDCILFFLPYQASFPYWQTLNWMRRTKTTSSRPIRNCDVFPNRGLMMLCSWLLPHSRTCASLRVRQLESHPPVITMRAYRLFRVWPLSLAVSMASGNLNLWFDWSADKWGKRLDARYCCLSLPVRFAAHIVRMYASVSFFFFDGFKVKTNVTD